MLILVWYVDWEDLVCGMQLECGLGLGVLLSWWGGPPAPFLSFVGMTSKLANEMMVCLLGRGGPPLSQKLVYNSQLKQSKSVLAV